MFSRPFDRCRSMGLMHLSFYRTVQFLREGLRPGDILEAGRLLDRPYPEVERHVGHRLGLVHGISPEAALDWLRRQPIMERQSVQAAGAAMAGRTLPARVEWRSTSGSIGARVLLPRDTELLRRMDAVMWAVYGWHGIGPADVQARFWGRPLAGRRRALQMVLDRATGRYRLDAFELTPERAVAFFGELRRSRPQWAYGYPSVMHIFADFCRAAGLDGRELGLRAVLTTGETLPDTIRSGLSEFFGARVVNEYGCTEAGILAIECEHAVPHAIPYAAWAEVSQDSVDSGEPAAPGNGEVLVTDLYGAVLPLVRYRLHDRAALGPVAPCRCGRSLAVLRVGIGRSGAFIVLPSGRRVYGGAISYCIPRGIQRFQARQISPTELQVSLVPGVGFDAGATVAAVRASLSGALGGEVRVAVNVVNQVSPDPSGKLRHFIPLEDPGPPPEPPRQ